eukprot:4208292-Pleurochrysis_carterae.AAC.2
MVPRIVSISCRSTLASCSGEITKRPLSSVVKARMLEMGQRQLGRRSSRRWRTSNASLARLRQRRPALWEKRTWEWWAKGSPSCKVYTN